jgi:hypothetical protein
MSGSMLSMKIMVVPVMFALGFITLSEGQIKSDQSATVLKPRESQPINKKMKADKLIDLSHVIENGLVTYKGLPAPIILSKDVLCQRTPCQA